MASPPNENEPTTLEIIVAIVVLVSLGFVI
jgi:hypothetical protein